MTVKIGKLETKKCTEVLEFHWQIPNFLSLPNKYYSPDSNFKFLNANWLLTIDPFEENTLSNRIGLSLKIIDAKLSYNVMCTFGIRKAGGSLAGIKTFKHIFSDNSMELRASNFFSRSALQEHTSELMPSNNLTVVCKLEHLNGFLIWIGLDTLSENIKCFFTNKELCDVTLQLQDKEFLAHKFILAARSPVFAAMFRHDTSEKQTGIIHIADCDPESFQGFLEYLYSGKLETNSLSYASQLYKIADKYDVQELKQFCVEYMSQNLDVKSFCYVLLLAEEYEGTKIFVDVQCFFNKNLKKILESDEWIAFLKKNAILANKLLLEMTSNVKVIE